MPVGGSDTPHSDRHTATVITRTESPRPSAASEGRSGPPVGEVLRGDLERVGVAQREQPLDGDGPGRGAVGGPEGGEVLRGEDLQQGVRGGPGAAEVEAGQPVHEGAAGARVGAGSPRLGQRELERVLRHHGPEVLHRRTGGDVCLLSFHG